MKNLVSRNPVQRFKQGRKIEKFQLGKNFKRVGTANNGLSGIYFNPDDSKLYKGVLTGYEYIGDSYKYTNYGTGKTGVINASDYVKKPLSGKTNININEELKVLNKLNPQSNTSVKTNTRTSIKNNTPVNNIWLNNYKHAEVKDVRAMQNQLIKLGLLKDKFGADGKWGKNTEEAYQKYLKSKQQQQAPELPSTTDLVKHITSQINFNQPNKSSAPFIYDQLQAAKEQAEKSSNNQYIPQEIPEQFLTMLMGKYKQGGQLPSRNPVRRFKLQRKGL